MKETWLPMQNKIFQPYFQPVSTPYQLELLGCQQLASLNEYTFGGPLHPKSGGRQGWREKHREGEKMFVENSLGKKGRGEMK